MLCTINLKEIRINYLLLTSTIFFYEKLIIFQYMLRQFLFNNIN